MIATVYSATPAIIEQALASAHAAKKEWAAMTGTERGRILRRAADIMRERNHDLSVLETFDTGKPYQETSVVDATSGADSLEYFGGLAAALRMRAKGYDVTVIERGDQSGGRAQVFENGGYRHDAGPTVITAPFLFRELFELFGKNLDDYVEFVPLDPWYRFRFPDGDTFDYGGTLEKTLAQIRRIEPADEAGYMKLLAHSKALYDVGFTELADRPFGTPWSMVRHIPSLLRLRSDRTVWQLVSHHLKSPKLRQAFSIQPLLVGEAEAALRLSAALRAQDILVTAIRPPTVLGRRPTRRCSTRATSAMGATRSPSSGPTRR